MHILLGVGDGDVGGVEFFFDAIGDVPVDGPVVGVVDQGRQIVLSADKSPSNLEEIGDRLRSRLSSGLVADLHPTTFELRLGILDEKAEHLGVSVPQKVKEFLAHKITSLSAMESQKWFSPRRSRMGSLTTPPS